MLAHLAEVDDRRLYAPAGHPSMFAWCVEELHLSEDAAFKRIRAARVARQFPVVFTMLADGQLHLTAVVMLTPYLTPANADELLAAATHRSNAAIEKLLAERFPRPDLPTRIEAVGSPRRLAPEPVESTDKQLAPEPVESTDGQLVLEPVESTDGQLAPGRVGSADVPPSPGTVRSRVAPLAPGRYGLQFTVEQGTYEKLRYAQALLGHAVPSGDLAEVVDRALDALIVRLEQRKFAATTRPHPRQQRTGPKTRHVPAAVRRAVWERDGGRCTFVSDAGHHCPARTRLEFDHIEPVARGGRATVKGLRLRCRAHNQYAAECAFGAGFMGRKRGAARRAAARSTADETRARAAAPEGARVRVAAAATAEEARARTAAAAEVVPWLRGLGLRLEEARRAAERCQAIPNALLEERVCYALSCIASNGHTARGPRPAP